MRGLGGPPCLAHSWPASTRGPNFGLVRYNDKAFGALRMTSIGMWDVAAHLTLFRSKGCGITQEKRMKIDDLLPRLYEKLIVGARHHPGVEFTRCEWHGNLCQLVLQPSTPFCTALNGARSQVIQLCAIPCKQICFFMLPSTLQEAFGCEKIFLVLAHEAFSVRFCNTYICQICTPNMFMNLV